MQFTTLTFSFPLHLFIGNDRFFIILVKTFFINIWLQKQQWDARLALINLRFQQLLIMLAHITYWLLSNEHRKHKNVNNFSRFRTFHRICPSQHLYSEYVLHRNKNDRAHNISVNKSHKCLLSVAVNEIKRVSTERWFVWFQFDFWELFVFFCVCYFLYFFNLSKICERDRLCICLAIKTFSNNFKRSGAHYSITLFELSRISFPASMALRA